MRMKKLPKPTPQSWTRTPLASTQVEYSLLQRGVEREVDVVIHAGAVVNLIVAYGILKGLPWSRVLYVVWGVIGLAVGYFTAPIMLAVMIGLIILVVIGAFLFSNRANEWFAARGLALTREDR